MSLRFIYCLIISSLAYSANSQDIVHWIMNQDATTNCSLIKSSKFVNEETGDKVTEGYTIEFTDKFVTEKIENGKYFLKSNIVFDTDCSYTLTVIETTIPSYEDQIGTIVNTEILETSSKDGLVKVRSRALNGEWKIFVLRKLIE